jgi:hypothetical protein
MPLRGTETPGATAGGASRLWRSDRLDVRIQQARLAPPQLEALASELAAFHARSAVAEAPATREALAGRVRAAAAAARAAGAGERALAEAIAAVEHAALTALPDRDALLADRAAAGRMRVRHGLLRAELIHVDSTPRAHLPAPLPDAPCDDVCADLARLALPIAAETGSRAAELLIAAYAAAAADYDLYAILRPHQALAALEVAEEILRGAGAPDAREAASAHALRMLRAALLEPRPARLLLAVGGVVASGKSTLAARTAVALAAPCVSSDEARGSVVHEAGGAGLLGAAWREATYAEVMRRAEAVLRSGRSVVVDGCFRSRAERAAARELAGRHGAAFLLVECRADAATIARRLAARDDPEVWRALAARVRSEWEAVRELSRGEHLVVDTSHDPDPAAERVARAIRRPPARAAGRGPAARAVAAGQ